MADNVTVSHERPTTTVQIGINGRSVTDTIEPRIKLSDFLRSHGTRSVRVGCEHGACGACSVIVDGDLVKSCLIYAVQADESTVETVEGLSDDDRLHPIPDAFHAEHALQCGFCTSGFIMATKALLADEPDPDQSTIEAGLKGNLCRCTGYQPIYRAVKRSAAQLTEME